MKTLTAILSFALALQAGPLLAQECVPFDSGEILCDDGSYLYYWSPASGEWQTLDREATLAALGVAPISGDPAPPTTDGEASVAYGAGSSLTSTDDGCTMFSAPGYGFGESLSFSSGC